jgi:hypothetical protein
MDYFRRRREQRAETREYQTQGEFLLGGEERVEVDKER